jgi:hypothetical protein
MKLRNPTWRAITLEVVMSDGVPLRLRIPAHASMDLTRYERAYEAALGALRAELAERAADE